MKKILTILLLSAMLLSFASCNTNNTDETSKSTTGTIATTETTDTTVTTDTTQTTDTTSLTETSDTQQIIIPEVFFEVPSDEKEVTKTVVSENADGMKMEIVLHGYASESLEKDFYVKHNEVIRMDVKIVNGSDKTYHQFLPTLCHGREHHSHEIRVNMKNINENSLTPCGIYLGCPDMWEVWDIEAGESYDFLLEYVAGMPYYAEDGEELYDIPLYGSEIYLEGTCDFAGNISFSYFDENENANDIVLSSDITLEIVYVQ